LEFTWYSLIDQVDWDTELREANNRVNPFGLYDMNRKIRPVGDAYKQIIKEYEEISVVPRIRGDFRCPAKRNFVGHVKRVIDCKKNN